MLRRKAELQKSPAVRFLEIDEEFSLDALFRRAEALGIAPEQGAHRLRHFRAGLKAAARYGRADRGADVLRSRAHVLHAADNRAHHIGDRSLPAAVRGGSDARLRVAEQHRHAVRGPHAERHVLPVGDEPVAVLGRVRQRRHGALGFRHIAQHGAVHLPREAKALGGKLRRRPEALPERSHALLPALALPLGIGL